MREREGTQWQERKGKRRDGMGGEGRGLISGIRDVATWKRKLSLHLRHESHVTIKPTVDI